MLNETKPMQIGELATLIVAVEERDGDRLRVSYDRDGNRVEEWHLESELIGLGFDDEE